MAIVCAVSSRRLGPMFKTRNASIVEAREEPLAYQNARVVWSRSFRVGSDHSGVGWGRIE